MSLHDESRHKMVTDAIEKHFKPKFKVNPQSKEEKLAEDLKALNTAVLRQIRPILKAGGGLDASDVKRLGLQDMINKLFLQGFEQFSKEELITICAMYHTEIAMGIVDTSPTGGTPDALGGV